MLERALPPAEEMYEAVLSRDTRYDGIFFTSVTTTGIFCRPGCPARTPNRENVRFHRSAAEALAFGFRPCRRCRPLEPAGRTPAAIRALLEEVERDPGGRIRDGDLRARGLDPRTVRRWFKHHHGMTFHAYQRARRLGGALAALSAGAPITRAAFENGYESLSGFQDALRRITGRSPGRSRDTVVVHLSRVPTPLGPMLLGATDAGACLLEFTDRPMLETQLRRLSKRLRCAFVPGPNEIGRRLAGELDEYFAGERRRFETALVTPGSDFQQRAWKALREVPYGQIRSYAEQARRLGAPSAVRAVARANGDNRLAIVIPCHRVVGHDGRPTGYGGGLWRKRWLLDHERSVLAHGAADSTNGHPAGAGR